MRLTTQQSRIEGAAQFARCYPCGYATYSANCKVVGR